jgi:primosomal protein DnaI
MEEMTMEKLKINNLPAYDADQKLLDDMKKAYQACPQAIKYCNELGIPADKVEENIIKIYDLVSDINYCSKCPGVKKCSKTNPLLCTRIVYSQGEVDRQMVPCKELLKDITFKKQFVVRDFEEDWLDSNLRSIDRNNGRNKAMVKYHDFIKNKQASWIYLTGSKNSGRSYFAASLIVDAARKNRGPVCFANSTLRLREINDLGYAKKKEEFDKKLDLYSNIPILVLDDFGNEFKNDFVRDAILFPILSTRASKRLLTIFTSDFTISDIEALYSNTKAGAIRAKQIAKLIQSMCDEEISLGDISIY